MSSAEVVRRTVKRAMTSPLAHRDMIEVVKYLRTVRVEVDVQLVEQKAGVSISGNRELVDLLSHNDRIRWNTANGTLMYFPRYPVHNRDGMLKMLRATTRGLLLTDLEDSYVDAADDVKALLNDNLAFAVHNPLRKTQVVFGNAQAHVQPLVDDELRELWHKVDFTRLTSMIEVENALRFAGLRPMQVEAEAPLADAGASKTRKASNRKYKMLNQHLDADVMQTLETSMKEGSTGRSVLGERRASS